MGTHYIIAVLVSLVGGACSASLPGSPPPSQGQPCDDRLCPPGQVCSPSSGGCVDSDSDPGNDDATDVDTDSSTGTAGSDGDTDSQIAPSASCDETIACVTSDEEHAAAPCNDGSTVAACASPAWDFCSCGGVAQTALFFDPPSGSGGPLRSVTLVTFGMDNLRLSVDGRCPGSPHGACDLEGGCEDTGGQIWIWTDFGGANVGRQGSHDIKVFVDDVGAPCWTDDGGRVLMAATFVTG